MSTFEVVNVVLTADLKQNVDLLKIAKLQYSIFNKEKYGGRVVYFKHPDMNGKVSIFSSGKMICVGVKSQEHGETDLIFTRDILIQNDFIHIVELPVKTRNYVAIQDEKFSIDLELFSTYEKVIYEPEQFPGAILKNNNLKSTFLIFASGKIVITGVKSLSDLAQASSFISQKLEQYK